MQITVYNELQTIGKNLIADSAQLAQILRILGHQNCDGKMDIAVRGGFYYVDYYQNGKRIRKSTGIEVDHKNWKKSKHALRLHGALDNIKLRPTAPPILNFETITFSELLFEYLKIHSLERFEYAKRTVETMTHAVRFIERLAETEFPAEVTREKVVQIRQKALETHSAVTVRDYFARARKLYAFAVRENLIRRNPFENILVRVKHQPPRIIAIEYEYQVFEELYKANPKVFAQLLFERITAFRVSEVCNLRWRQVDLQGNVIRYLNPKGSHDNLPITPLIQHILNKYGEKGEFVFHYRTRWAVTRPLVAASGAVLGEPYASHQLKRCFSQEIDSMGITDRLFEQLMHHAPATSRTGVMHYSGRNLNLMLMILSSMHGHWLEFIQKLECG